ncbi:glycosyltransferase family 4 protein [Legionella bozemanae]|uniref:Glycosyltransferase n=1 Tax=Legionella bozemanae TaxID=447 RepID=A0A0W0RSK3_LEGBO|nr:glycosyltransferase family 4 protein [Legionella bozemanae]KTC74037.1 glycosyltransferase [Legionella bozemanae]STO33624.1 GDP-mannose-dependent alpha-(1-6)-phosphatidylinositol monomannoside mannosyltransferase [Legionella bozemanae]
MPPQLLKIALITDNYYPQIGGVEYCVDALGRYLAELGHQVCIITRKRKNLPTEESKGSLLIKRISYSEMYIALSGFSRQYNEFFAQFDIIHAHSLGSILAVQALLLAKKIKKAHVLTSHSLYRDLDKRLIKCFALLVNHVICVSHAIAENMKSLKKTATTYYIPNGFDTISPNPKDVEKIYTVVKNADELIITTVSRLSSKKKVADFILIAHELLKKYKKLKFFIVGDGPQNKKLQRMANQLGLSEYLFFTGNISRSSVFNLIQQTDIFVLTSPHEAFGMVILEAIYHKVPVVAYANNGISDIISSEKTGFLVSSIDEMIEKIIQLIHNKALRLELGNNAHPLINKFKWEDVAKETLSVYYTLLISSHPHL